MLNPSFSTNAEESRRCAYVLPEELTRTVVARNAATDTLRELRLQPVYRYELGLKLRSLGLTNLDWSGKRVLDVCCGTGFLSYHLLSMITPKELTLNDISGAEMGRARELIDSIQYSNNRGPLVRYMQADILSQQLPGECFDVVIGNSFLHHLHNVPLALQEFHRLLSPGGLFITLHEPTVAAVALESGTVRLCRTYMSQGEQYINSLRFNGEGVRSGQGSDVWLFRRTEVAGLAKQSGFCRVASADWHLVRPWIVARMALHLTETKAKLRFPEEMLLRMSAFIDSVLRQRLPSHLFGSFCLLAQKAAIS